MDGAGGGSRLGYVHKRGGFKVMTPGYKGINSVVVTPPGRMRKMSVQQLG